MTKTPLKPNEVAKIGKEKWRGIAELENKLRGILPYYESDDLDSWFYLLREKDFKKLLNLISQLLITREKEVLERVKKEIKRVEQAGSHDVFDHDTADTCLCYQQALDDLSKLLHQHINKREK